MSGCPGRGNSFFACVHRCKIEPHEQGAVRPLLQEKEGLWTYMGISACPVWTRTRTGS